MVRLVDVPAGLHQLLDARVGPVLRGLHDVEAAVVALDGRRRGLARRRPIALALRLAALPRRGGAARAVVHAPRSSRSRRRTEHYHIAMRPHPHCSAYYTIAPINY